MYRMFSTLLVSLIFLTACNSSSEHIDLTKIAAPVAKIVPHTLTIHNDSRVDNYFWLKHKTDPEVIAYLEAENAYTEQMTAHTEDLQTKLFEEIKGRIKQADSTVPYKEGDYYYYTRYVEGKEYSLFCRKYQSTDADEQILIDGNIAAGGHEFFALASKAISSGQEVMAFAVDTTGRPKYTLRFRNLTNGEDFDEAIPEVTGNVAWAADNKTIFYSKQDPETLRWYQIYRHELGTDPAKDVLVYEEEDDTFETEVYQTKSKEYIIIGSSQTMADEYRCLRADDPTGTFKLFIPRERGHEFSLDHLGGKFYMRTNWAATNFRIMATDEANTNRSAWQELIAHSNDVFIGEFELLDDYIAVDARKHGLAQILIQPLDGSPAHFIDFGEPAYDAYIDENHVAATSVLRYGYESMTTPESIIDYNIATGEKTVLKEEEILGGFDKSNYITERLAAPATDGTLIPISIVYRKGLKQDGSAPCLLYGYGSYGINEDPGFRSTRISLLDRGFAYAIAHVRGSQTMGRSWYEDGRLFKKKNRFTEFISCAQFLVESKFTSSNRLFAQGGSAGGLLVGAVANMAPELFHGIIAEVPWVDVVTTMLDPDIPLVTSEYDEWGNPEQREYYDYMLSYSPYDQVAQQAYPNMLITTSLEDSQVQYWEPAKWTAKLRANKTDSNRLLFKIEMAGGHGGPSGRFKRYHETAFEYAFLLDLAGIAK